MPNLQEWKKDMVLFDDLQLIKKIGQGGMGQVWLGKQLSWNQLVAAKQSIDTNPKKMEALEKEADLWLEAGLHPYITTCYYTRNVNSQTIIVLEYANEGTLSQWISDERLYGTAPLYHMMRFGLQSAWGLACAHTIGKGLLHLDVKPENILINDGNAKISDFGLSKAKTMDRSVPGYTLKYAAPEQLENGELTNKTDVYCWAVTMLSMAAKGADWMSGSTAQAILEEYTDSNNFAISLPKELYALLKACLNSKPKMRPDMEEAGDELSGLMKLYCPGQPIPEKLIKRQPLSAAEYNNRAVFLFEKGDKKKATRYFNEAEAMAMEIAVPKYNRMIAEFYMNQTTPAKMITEFSHFLSQPEKYSEKKISAQLCMLNGDLRSLLNNPGIVESSMQVREWMKNGATGQLFHTEPKIPAYINDSDERNIHDILTKGSLKHVLKNNMLCFHLNSICSPKRKTYLMDNNKGAFLLGGINSGEEPWQTCVIRKDRYDLKTTFFIGEYAVYLEQTPKPICYFKNPQNILFFDFPSTFKKLRNPRILKYESLDDVCAIGVHSSDKGHVVMVIDTTSGISDKNSVLIENYDGGDIIFRNDGALQINGQQIIEPDRWNGKKRKSENPSGFHPPNNTADPTSKILLNFGSNSTLIRHSDRFLRMNEKEIYQYACFWKHNPYHYLAMFFDAVPASGGTLILGHKGKLLTIRLDREKENPPSNPKWIMMKAASGAVVTDRNQLLEKLEEKYEQLLIKKEYHAIDAITEKIRPLVLQEENRALSLWKKISQAFPKGDPFIAIPLPEGEEVSSDDSHSLKYPLPQYPGLPFSVKTSEGKVGYKYHYRSGQDDKYPSLHLTRYDGKSFYFNQSELYSSVTIKTSSLDGMFHFLLSAKKDYDQKPTSIGFLVRIFDLKKLKVIYEKEYPHLPWSYTFTFWRGHTLYLFIDGLYVLNLDTIKDTIMDLGQPLIPIQGDISDPGFLGAQCEYFKTTENIWYICSEILPVPIEKLNNPRFLSLKGKLPFRKKNKRKVLLKEGFGTLWADILLK